MAFDWKSIGMGNWITLVTVSVAIIWGWKGFIDTGNDVDDLQSDVKGIRTELSARQLDSLKNRSEFELRLKQLETMTSTINDKFVDSGRALDRVASSIDTMNTSLRTQASSQDKASEEIRLRLGRIECIIDESCRPNASGARRPSTLPLAP